MKAREKREYDDLIREENDTFYYINLKEINVFQYIEG